MPACVGHESTRKNHDRNLPTSFTPVHQIANLKTFDFLTRGSISNRNSLYEFYPFVENCNSRLDKSAPSITLCLQTIDYGRQRAFQRPTILDPKDALRTHRQERFTKER